MPTNGLVDVPVNPADVTPLMGQEAERAGPEGPQAPRMPRHPIVMVAVLGVPLLAFVVFGFSGHAFVTAISSAVLVALAATDIEHRVLPNRILLPAIPVLLVAQVAFFPDRALEWALAGLAAAAFLALPLIVRRDAMGMGDIKLAVLLGVATGWPVFGAIVIGCVATIPATLWMLSRQGSIKGATLPFGPFLAFGTLVVLFTS